MAPDFREQYVTALELVRERLWPELAVAFHRLQARDCGSPEYAQSDWDQLQHGIFDAIALAVLDVRGVPSPVAHLPHPVPLDQASDLARERYWPAANTSFHVVWSRAVGRDGYVKTEWQGFEDRIVEIIAAAIVATSGGSAPFS